jgi:hypothetical protein
LHVQHHGEVLPRLQSAHSQRCLTSWLWQRIFPEKSCKRRHGGESETAFQNSRAPFTWTDQTQKERSYPRMCAGSRDVYILSSFTPRPSFSSNSKKKTCSTKNGKTGIDGIVPLSPCCKLEIYTNLNYGCDCFQNVYAAAISLACVSLRGSCALGEKSECCVARCHIRKSGHGQPMCLKLREMYKCLSFRALLLLFTFNIELKQLKQKKLAVHVVCPPSVRESFTKQ